MLDERVLVLLRVHVCGAVVRCVCRQLLRQRRVLQGWAVCVQRKLHGQHVRHPDLLALLRQRHVHGPRRVHVCGGRVGAHVCPGVQLRGLSVANVRGGVVWAAVQHAAVSFGVCERGVYGAQRVHVCERLRRRHVRHPALPRGLPTRDVHTAGAVRVRLRMAGQRLLVILLSKWVQQ